jgi:hypothetical protein
MDVLVKQKGLKGGKEGTGGFFVCALDDVLIPRVYDDMLGEDASFSFCMTGLKKEGSITVPVVLSLNFALCHKKKKGSK